MLGTTTILTIMYSLKVYLKLAKSTANKEKISKFL